MASRSSVMVVWAFLLAAAGVAQTPQVVRERARNDRAFAREVDPRLVELRAAHPRGWLVVAHGVVLPRDGDVLAPAASLADADAAARKAFPDTAHRYVVSLAEPLDVRWILGMAYEPPVAGERLLRAIGGVVIHAGGVAAQRGGAVVDLGGNGPRGGARLRAQLEVPETAPSPDGAEPLRSSMLASNIFTGAVWLDAPTAARLDLANWEIPGRATLLPGYDPEREIEPRAVCRRAWLWCVFPELDQRHLLPVAIDPGAGRAPPNAASEEPKKDGRRRVRPTPKKGC